MALYVHLTPESQAAQIRRVGIRRAVVPFRERPGGIFAMPVTRHFQVSHQWLRELKRFKRGPMFGVYFRIGDDEPVWVGHYGQPHAKMTAADALASFSGPEERQGWEVIIPRAIEPGEIHRIRALPQLVGWRFFPAAKGKPPFCTCKSCTRGEYGSARLRQRIGEKDV
ncbi:hypothetical protein [Singulisphaera sp. PoT]|uniref:hypothetical protein n=1 Tax=Singulisphaera sp. PoT TaxID=3411797 RepID=UPI003BF55D75